MAIPPRRLTLQAAAEKLLRDITTGPIASWLLVVPREQLERCRRLPAPTAYRCPWILQALQLGPSAITSAAQCVQQLKNRAATMGAPSGRWSRPCVRVRSCTRAIGAVVARFVHTE